MCLFIYLLAYLFVVYLKIVNISDHVGWKFGMNSELEDWWKEVAVCSTILLDKFLVKWVQWIVSNRTGILAIVKSVACFTKVKWTEV